ncbi:MAG: fluoride efflux transporter CrcB [Pseudomonadota bacterium]
MLTAYLAVAAGGAAGSLARYIFVGQAARLLGAGFPWGTLGVNITGSLLMGLAAGFFAARTAQPSELQLFISTGVLGGFTTFSAFSLDIVNLYARGQWLLAAEYSAASFGLSVGALLIGLTFMRRLLA